MHRRDFLRRLGLVTAGLLLTERPLGYPEEFSPEDARMMYARLDPFTTIDGKPFPLREHRATVIFSRQETPALIDIAQRRALDHHLQERATVETYQGVRLRRLSLLNYTPASLAELHHPKLVDENDAPLRLRTGKVLPEEDRYLDDITHFGVELTNPGNRVRYDPDWVRVLRKKPHLHPTDCTRYLLDEYTPLSGEHDLLTSFVHERSRHNPRPRFPWMFAMRLRKDFETVLVIPDTADPKPYTNGSRKGWTNSQLIQSVKSHNYYLDPDYGMLDERFKERYLKQHDIPSSPPVVDYCVLDDAVRGEEFKHFLSQTKGFATKHDFYHAFWVREGSIYEAYWGNNPLFANTFAASSLAEKLTTPGTENAIQNMILWLPRGTVEAYRAGRIDDILAWNILRKE